MTISGQLARWRVNDTRDGSPDTGWVVTVSAANFTTPSGATIPASSVSYSAGPFTQTRGAGTYTDDEPDDLTAAVPAVTAGQISGDNAEVTWDPTISVLVPGDAPSGVYTTKITHSVS